MVLGESEVLQLLLFITLCSKKLFQNCLENFKDAHEAAESFSCFEDATLTAVRGCELNEGTSRRKKVTGDGSGESQAGEEGIAEMKTDRQGEMR